MKNLSVKIDSGEFPLLRRININHQPSMENVVSKWMWAFQTNVPESLNALADVIEDVYSHPRLLEYHQRGPEEMLEYIGIGHDFASQLEVAAKLIRSTLGSNDVSEQIPEPMFKLSVKEFESLVQVVRYMSESEYEEEPSEDHIYSDVLVLDKFIGNIKI
jgi:hypothetical protein